MIDNEGNGNLVNFGLVPMLKAATSTTKVVDPVWQQAPEVLLTEGKDHLPSTLEGSLGGAQIRVKDLNVGSLSSHELASSC